MTYARDLARIYHGNGYKPIPADAKAKVPRVSGFYDHYDFDTFWQNWLDCDVALVLDGLVCCDFDRHGDSPNGGDYFDMLYGDHPEIFQNCIIEQTKSRGIHVYYRWTLDLPDKEWRLPITIDSKNVAIEIKTGRRLAFCYPSENYKLLQGSFEETKLSRLAPLSTVFRYYKPAPKPRLVFNPIVRKDMTPEQMERAVDIIVDIYRPNAAVEQCMHPGALGMACYMAGLGYGAHDITRAVKSYGRHGHREFRNEKEISELVQYGLDHPDRKAIPPWKHLKKV